jgi:hypothetical protein
MLSLIPAELWIVLTGVASAVLAFFFGTRSGKKGEQAKQAQRDLQSAIDAKNRREEISDETDQELHDRLTGRD